MSKKDHIKRKSILLISHNFLPEPTGIGKYNGEMIEWLAKNNYNCTVITTYPYYPHWKVQKPYKNGFFKKEVIHNPDSRPITVYRCPSYVPSRPTGKKRILQDFSFWTSFVWKILHLMLNRQKFDLIITVAPPFHLPYLGLMVKKRNGGKLLYHIQDLQIEAAQELNMLSNKKLFDYIYKLESQIIEKADYVSSISEGMIAKIQAKINREVLFFPNWVDTSVFFPLDDREKLKAHWGYKQSDVVFLYSGAIGEKQGLEIILQVAEKMTEHPEFKFIICGSGPYKEKLIEKAKAKNLANVDFLPVQAKEEFNQFLNMADYHLVLQKSTASDLVMPSKLTTILAVGGVCIVTSPVDSSLYNLVNHYDVGYAIEPENEDLLMNLIKSLSLDSSFERKQAHARSYALKYLNIDNVMTEFVSDVHIAENAAMVHSHI